MPAADSVHLIRRTRRIAVLLCSLGISINAQVSAQQSGSSFRTTVTPLASEDIAQTCTYEMQILSATKKIRGIFVIIERGPQSHRFYNDIDVLFFAKKHSLAMMMPLHCARKGDTDMNVDPARGLGRAFLAAVDQFSVQTAHAELKTAPVIFLGFSGAGALAARMADFAPNRTAAIVVSHGGSSPLNLDTIHLSNAALEVPELIIAGGKDHTVGTELSYAYFSEYWFLGAPWLFAIQNDAGHCCTFDAKPLILNWLDGILQTRLQRARGVLRPIQKKSGYYAFFQKIPTSFRDSGNIPTSRAANLSFRQIERLQQQNESPAGWLPSRSCALQWQTLADLPPLPPPLP